MKSNRRGRWSRLLLSTALVLASGCGGSGGSGPDTKLCGQRGPAAGAPQWAKDAAFYEVFVRSYADSDGDGVGDLRGLISHLDYLNDGKPGGSDLGVDGLWLMPIFKAASYHGYDTVDYEAIDPAYGTMPDFDRLIAEAHRRGIRILLDLVMNHTSDQHPWFQASEDPASAKRDYYVWSATDPGWTQPWGGTDRSWHPGPSGFYYGVFWSGMPDLNYRNAAVRDEMTRIAKGWLDRGVDGFRFDAVRYLIEDGAGSAQQDTNETHAFWKDFRASLKSAHPDAFLVAEAWADPDTISKYYGAADEFDAAFDFPLESAIADSILSRNRFGLEGALCTLSTKYRGDSLDAPFLDNHDMSRVGSRLQGDVAALKLAGTILLTLPGAPFVYYGGEIGMRNGQLEGGDINYRTPMQWSSGTGAGFTRGTPWLPINADAGSLNVQAQVGDAGSLLAHYRAVLAVRHRYEALRQGSIVPVAVTGTDAETRLYAYVRPYSGKAVVVVLNFGTADVTNATVDLSGVGISPGSMVDAMSGQSLAALSGANLAAYPIDDLPGVSARLIATSP